MARPAPPPSPRPAPGAVRPRPSARSEKSPVTDDDSLRAAGSLAAAREALAHWSQLAASAHDARERAIAALAGDQQRVVTGRQLAAIGLTHGSVCHRLRQGRLTRRHRDVFVVGTAPLAPGGRRLAAVLACGEGAAASHRDAAAAHGLLREPSGPVHVTTPAGNGSCSRQGIRVHRYRRLTDGEVAVVDGCRVTSVARTLVDLGDVAAPEQVRRAFVRAEQQQLVDMPAIETSLAGAGRLRGARVLRELLRAYDPRWSQTRSALELAMLDAAQRFGLPEPEVNAWLLRRYLVDFLWRDARVVLETDGAEFHGTPSARRDDARRDHSLRRSGFTVVRASYAEVTGQPAAVAARVLAALAARSRR